MMDFAPIARIALRYLVGYLIGAEAGEAMALDPDVVTAVALGIGFMVEAAYAWAKARGGKT